MLRKLITLLLLGLTLSSCKLLEGEAPTDAELGFKLQNIGQRRGYALRPCEPKPNCIASFEVINDPKNLIKPIRYSEPKDVAVNKLLSIILKMDGFKLTKQSQDYFYGVSTSMFGLLVDDVEFDLREKDVIHFRSASRVMPFDFGSNKRRIEDIRFKFHQNDI